MAATGAGGGAPTALATLSRAPTNFARASRSAFAASASKSILTIQALHVAQSSFKSSVRCVQRRILTSVRPSGCSGSDSAALLTAFAARVAASAAGGAFVFCTAGCCCPEPVALPTGGFAPTGGSFTVIAARVGGAPELAPLQYDGPKSGGGAFAGTAGGTGVIGALVLGVPAGADGGGARNGASGPPFGGAPLGSFGGAPNPFGGAFACTAAAFSRASTLLRYSRALLGL